MVSAAMGCGVQWHPSDWTGGTEDEHRHHTPCPLAAPELGCGGAGEGVHSTIDWIILSSRRTFLDRRNVENL